jgi:hypothetical protein
MNRAEFASNVIFKEVYSWGPRENNRVEVSIRLNLIQEVNIR